jgi:formylglycine-generating enzyme required for sulfatase activity
MGVGAVVALAAAFAATRLFRGLWTTLPVDMVAIPAGTAVIGSDAGEVDERPSRRLEVAAFELDRFEVTLEEYGACVEAGACEPSGRDYLECNARRADRAEHPVNCVSHAMASVFCKFRGARLPTEIEWEYAARGGDGRTYPWGDEPPKGKACYLRKQEGKGTCAVRAPSPDRSPFGVMGLAGNVSEWTATAYCASGDRRGCKEGAFVTRGGSYDMENPTFVRASYRDFVDAGRTGYNLGFRCAR